jgi:hypothetical protein
MAHRPTSWLLVKQC